MILPVIQIVGLSENELIAWDSLSPWGYVVEILVGFPSFILLPYLEVVLKRIRDY